MANKSKKGFTLAEIMVAMAIASIISFAALSIMVLSNSVSKKATLRFNLVSEIDNLVECFKASENLTEFEEAITFYYMPSDSTQDINKYFVKSIANGAEPTDFTYTYRIFFTENRLPIMIEPILVEIVDGKMVYTGAHSFYIEIKIEISTDPADPYAIFSAYGNNMKNSEKELYSMKNERAFRKNGVFIDE